jgi:hypothetical protein
VLTGTYQRDRALPTATQIENDQRPARAREFLTFFDDGTFLYGINSPDSAITTCPLSGDGTFPSCSLTGTTPRGPGEAGPSQAAPLGNFNSVSGVDHGFYVYDPAADTIVFTLTNASNTFPNYLALNGMPGYLDGEVTATNVQKTDATADEGGKISLRFVGERPGPRPGVGSAFTAVTESTTWNMTEPLAINGEITGAWITADHLRVFAYNKNEFFGFYMSADGLLTLQDACYLIDDLSTQSAGTLNRHSGFSATCSPGGSARFRDIPVTRVGEVATMPKLPLGYQGRYPGSDSPLDGRPAQPSLFEVTPGVGGADDLEVHATLSGTPIDDTWAPSFFTRERANPAVP